MSDPRTEAGRRLFSRLWAVNDYDGASQVIATVSLSIAQIEAEAAAAPDAADLARWLQEWAESQPAITIRRGVEPQVAWRALADELLRRWGR